MEIRGKRVNSNKCFRKPYQTWYNMMQRCYNSKNPYYKNYGGKGVTVCERWKELDNFIEDYDKIKGFSEKVFYDKNIFLDKDGKASENKEYNIDNCEFVDVSVSNVRKPNQMWPFKVTKGNETKIYNNQSECSKETGLRQGGISNALNKSKFGLYKGYKFDYIDS